MLCPPCSIAVALIHAPGEKQRNLFPRFAAHGKHRVCAAGQCLKPRMVGAQLTVTISDLHASGVGVADHKGYGRIYVPFTFPGEEIHIELRDEARAGQWNAVRISTVENFCAHAGRCGGCLWPGADYPAQLVWKQKLLQRALQNYAALAALAVTVHASAKTTGVRNRLHLHGNFFHARFDFGFYARGSKKLVAIEDCPMGNEPLRHVVSELHALRSALFSVTEDFGFGIELIHFTAESGPSPAVQMVLYASPARHNALQCALPVFAGLPGVQVVIRGAEGEGDMRLWQIVDGVELFTRPGCFQQGNSAQADAIRNLIGRRISATETKILFDLYSGSGNYSLPFARDVASIFGCDENAAGIAVARYNATHNAIGNVQYDCGNTATVLKDRAAFGWPEQADLVVLDPARFGIDQEIPGILAQVAPKEVILISNNLTALAKDCRAFLGAGFTPTALHLVDFFPNTPHMDVVSVWRFA